MRWDAMGPFDRLLPDPVDLAVHERPKRPQKPTCAELADVNPLRLTPAWRLAARGGVWFSCRT